MHHENSYPAEEQPLPVTATDAMLLFSYGAYINPSKYEDVLKKLYGEVPEKVDAHAVYRKLETRFFDNGLAADEATAKLIETLGDDFVSEYGDRIRGLAGYVKH